MGPGLWPSKTSCLSKLDNHLILLALSARRGTGHGAFVPDPEGIIPAASGGARLLLFQGKVDGYAADEG